MAARLRELVKSKVTKVDEVVGDKVKAAVNGMKNGDIVLVENVRFNPGETKNKPEFVQQLVDCIHPDITIETGRFDFLGIYGVKLFDFN